jgi:hypothetical protein
MVRGTEGVAGYDWYAYSACSKEDGWDLVCSSNKLDIRQPYEALKRMRAIISKYSHFHLSNWVININS